MKDSLLEFSQKCLLDINHEYFSFVDTNKAGIAIFSTYPNEWTSRYLAKKYYENDYGLVKNLFLPYAWGENHSKDLTPLQKQIFKEAEGFRIFKGITIPFFSKNSTGVITLAFSKGEKLPQHRILKLGADLLLPCQLIITYKDLIEREDETQATVLKLINEITIWQKDRQQRKRKYTQAIGEALSDIRAAQMFIMHHETKDLGLETLHRAYKDVERLI